MILTYKVIGKNIELLFVEPSKVENEQWSTPIILPVETIVEASFSSEREILPLGIKSSSLKIVFNFSLPIEVFWQKLLTPVVFDDGTVNSMRVYLIEPEANLVLFCGIANLSKFNFEIEPKYPTIEIEFIEFGRYVLELATKESLNQLNFPKNSIQRIQDFYVNNIFEGWELEICRTGYLENLFGITISQFWQTIFQYVSTITRKLTSGVCQNFTFEMAYLPFFKVETTFDGKERRGEQISSDYWLILSKENPINNLFLEEYKTLWDYIYDYLASNLNFAGFSYDFSTINLIGKSIKTNYFLPLPGGITVQKLKIGEGVSNWCKISLASATNNEIEEITNIKGASASDNSNDFVFILNLQPFLIFEKEGRIETSVNYRNKPFYNEYNVFKRVSNLATNQEIDWYGEIEREGLFGNAYAKNFPIKSYESEIFRFIQERFFQNWRKVTVIGKGQLDLDDVEHLVDLIYASRNKIIFEEIKKFRYIDLKYSKGIIKSLSIDLINFTFDFELMLFEE